MSYANAPARLPGLPAVKVADRQLQLFIDAVREILEVRAGTRGDKFERAITLRDLAQMGLLDESTLSGPSGRMMAGGGGVPSSQGNGGVLVHTGTRYVPMDFEAFARIITDSKLFRSLTKSLSDPSRFDGLPERVRALLAKDIAEEARKRGAEILRLDEKIQTATESSAMAVQEVTAALGESVAGVRETTFANATANAATAGKVTQIRAALGDPDSFTGAGVTLEESMFGSATTEGLYGQYTLKIDGGGKIAGIGLAVDAPLSGPVTSAFMVQADRFAIVDSSDTIADPLNPPLERIPFGVDTVNNVIYINGSVRINAGGTALEDIGDGESVIVEWSITGAGGWHDTYVGGDKFARWKVGVAGAWQGPFQVVGENGAAGNYVAFIFKRAATIPATPTGATPAGWSDAPPAADGNPLWVSTATKTAAGALVGSWGTPVRIDGTNGTNGSNGANGTRGTRQLYASSASYTASYNNGAGAGAPSYAVQATSLIASATAGSTPTTPIQGDTVTFTNGSSYTYTITYNGSAWATPGVVIDGSLLVSGSITTTHLASTVSLSTNGYAYIAGNSNYTITDVGGSSSSGTASVFANGGFGGKFGVVGYSADSGGAGIHGYNANATNGPGVSGRGRLGVHGVATADAGAGGYFQSFSGAGRAIEATGYIHATGAINTDSSIDAGLRVKTPSIYFDQAPTTGSATATFPGNNKPGGSSTAQWLACTAVISGFAQTVYIPVWT